VVSGKDTMTNYPYILFNKSPLQLRDLGARGGRAYGRNLRARRALLTRMPLPPPPVSPCAAPGPTAAEAVALLDAQFPWLRAAEKRAGRETASAHGTRLTRMARSRANNETDEPK
jgi:hypothetical protein